MYIGLYAPPSRVMQAAAESGYLISRCRLLTDAWGSQKLLSSLTTDVIILDIKSYLPQNVVLILNLDCFLSSFVRTFRIDLPINTAKEGEDSVARLRCFQQL